MARSPPLTRRGTRWSPHGALGAITHADAIVPFDVVCKQPILSLSGQELDEEGREQVAEHATDGARQFLTRRPRTERYDPLDAPPAEPLVRRERGRQIRKVAELVRRGA